jgi:glucosamine-6-phosphate deaminase
MYAELIRLHREQQVDFSAARIFSLDELVGLPESDPRTFRNYLWANFLNAVNVHDEHVTLAPSSGGVLADAYEDAIREAGGIDLLIAGLGTNGHIAFNEPGSPFDSRTRVVDLAESTVTAMAISFDDRLPPRQAVTIGIATILEARQIVLLATGASKSSALKRAVYGTITEEVPASALRLHGAVTVIADTAAAE